MTNNAKNILVILGHPRNDSYCEALFDRYVEGAKSAGANVEKLKLYTLSFELNVKIPNPQDQHEEPDISEAKEKIKWANHIVIISPVWWGSVPALLKGFMDRCFVPSFAFYERKEGDYAQLLKGKTGELLLTMDTPTIIYKVFVGAPATKMLKTATLKFCGIAPVKVHYCSPIKHSAEKTKKQWLQKAFDWGSKAGSVGVANIVDKYWLKLLPWLKALRLQFYPMTFFAYGAGAFAISTTQQPFSVAPFLIGYVLIFLMEVVAVFTNELADFESDKINQAYGPFNGGSRVLVNGEILPHQMKRSLVWIQMVIAVLAIYLIATSTLQMWQPLVVISGTLFLAKAYTAKPMKFSYHTLGEITVAITHSIAAILCGYVFQHGNIADPLPWLFGLPLSLSILPSITLSNIPDSKADATINKQTIAVRFGVNAAAGFATLCTVATSCITAWWFFAEKITMVWSWPILLAIPHAVWLCWELMKFIQLKQKPATINKLMILALTFMMWYTLVPFFRLK